MAKGPKRTSNESTSELDTILTRLRVLGATADEIEQLVTGWDDFDGHSWTPEIRAEFVRAPDGDLITELQCVRVEHRLHTHTEDEEHVEDVHADAQALVQAAHDYRSSSIADVLEWVDGDQARAAAMLAVETSSDGSNRKTLVPVLEGLADGVLV